jgi:[CysO sulfur-carrier protein]-S-L-cysteine hydrolase
VVIPGAVRDAIAAHARHEEPNESCGLVALRDGVAERYVAGTNGARSPYRFELEVDPHVWVGLEDDGYELGVVHSHLSSPPRPSRTDVENVGLWAGRLYVIYCVARDELAAWTVTGDGAVEPVSIEPR